MLSLQFETPERHVLVVIANGKTTMSSKVGAAQQITDLDEVLGTAPTEAPET
ncbi:hypothetical protein SJ05684_c19090 [Sinorhizobium sojae CCBAU 05684]|uniref:Uncharacterized protein n=1 Tax=Sinorhizobium sojae CCBAU 05684 TaxID=716928 RepID=A0A249PBR2_9HYPH|nr:hypothetical protein SJ05684_c19090 [Sinorhizobium sojae CCBAU 05684]